MIAAKKVANNKYTPCSVLINKHSAKTKPTNILKENLLKDFFWNIIAKYKMGKIDLKLSKELPEKKRIGKKKCKIMTMKSIIGRYLRGLVW